MKKKNCVLFLFALIATYLGSAQISMNVPYGSFEQWTAHPGYSVTALFMPVSVYDSYSTPTGWNHLAYPVNESVSIMGFTVNVNTNLPLIITSHETGSVPDGSSAVKLQTFMLSDIISPTVYSLAAGSLDTMLTNMVFPSVLSTGAVNIGHFIPIMNTLISNMDSVETLLASMASEDVNYYITGGISLGDLEPTRLTGSYKYHSAVEGDNGGVLILGTRYNSTLGKRELVGGGVNIELSDCTNYSPFTVAYQSLHDYDASYPVQAPDSLIVMLVSSASMNRQQGSWLCVDNLVLWQDTCPSIVDVAAVPDIHEAVLSWGVADSVLGFELTFAPDSVTIPDETSLTLSTNSITLTGLDASTRYDVMIRTVCSNNIYGDWSHFHFTTLADTCARVTSIALDSSNASITSDHLAAGYVATWTSTYEPDGWLVTCAPVSPEQTTDLIDTVHTPSYSFGLLLPEQQYILTVNAFCSDTIFGVGKSILFTTLADIPPTDTTITDTTTIDTTTTDTTTTAIETLFPISNTQLSVYPNPVKDRLTVESHGEPLVAVKVYDIHWKLMLESNSPTIDVSRLPIGVYFLRAHTAPGHIGTARFIKEL